MSLSVRLPCSTPRLRARHLQLLPDVHILPSGPTQVLHLASITNLCRQPPSPERPLLGRRARQHCRRAVKSQPSIPTHDIIADFDLTCCQLVATDLQAWRSDSDLIRLALFMMRQDRLDLGQRQPHWHHPRFRTPHPRSHASHTQLPSRYSPMGLRHTVRCFAA